MSDEWVRLEVSDGVGLVTMDRKPVNALSREMRRALVATFDAISEREDIRCAVLTGAGSVFCAGADLKDRPDADVAGDFLAHNRITRETGNSIRECAKPVIAAINGAALGAGFGLVMGSDIWVASEDAYVSMPEINVGLAGGVTFLQKFFSQSRARRMFYTGMQVSAQELYRLGLVEACLPAAELMPYAMGIAREIASKSPIAVRLAKEAARMTLTMPPRDAYRYEQGNTVALSKTEDTKEAQRAFFEKRKPVFTGR